MASNVPLVEKETPQDGWSALSADSGIFTGTLIAVEALCLGYMHATKMTYQEKTAMTAPSYVMFIDVSIMIFFGFGFLMTFLKRNGYTAVGLCVIVSAVVIQLSIVVEDLLNNHGMLGAPPMDNTWSSVSLFNLINGLFCAGAVMISMGAVLGKVSPSQLLFMGLIETVLYWVSFSLYTNRFGAQDAAGGIVLHAFGCYFGLTVAKVITTEAHLKSDMNDTIYSSDLFSLTGTLFLWLLWPSFCAAVAPSEAEGFYAVVNTFLALIGSVLSFAAVTRILHEGKLNITECQNATLAGGVAMGVPAIYPMGPAQALIVGLVAGAISTFGYARIDLGEIAGCSDTCGVNNLHGMPGLLSGVVGFLIYPIHAQLIGFACSLGIAIVGGLVTGFILKALPSLGDGDEFGDTAFWEVADDY